MYSITGLGACQEVGRSGFLLDFGEKFLLDYGLKLNPKGIEYPLDVNANIKAAIISHAHLDHSGYLPYFYTKSEAISFMTQPTLEIAEILWLDSIKIAEFEGLMPRYTKKEVQRTHKYNFISNYKKKMHLSNDNSLEFFDAGHILGSAFVKLTHNDKSFLYTGDFKATETQLHVGADLNVGKLDYVLIESTYGDREHPNRKDVERSLCESVQQTIDNGGWAIIPAFAVGRSQELVDILTGYGVQADIWLDGMGKQVADLYIKHSELIKNPKKLKAGLSQVKWVTGIGDRKKILKKPCVVVTTSGMMKGGPVVGYAQKLMNDPNSKIHLSGYQALETPGRMLQDEGMLPYGPGETPLKVSCKYEKYVLSAHPSQEEMIGVLKKWSPKKIFLVHGDKDVMPVFKNKIKERLGIDTTILELGKKIEFD
ncbi:MAG: MBL fold metallo-hydrolase [Candidatus ainarchaeum sp.]|nr:MBL fold metallo-hydrolase [Candidatus ainarchaeum sp.]